MSRNNRPVKCPLNVRPTGHRSSPKTERIHILRAVEASETDRTPGAGPRDATRPSGDAQEIEYRARGSRLLQLFLQLLWRSCNDIRRFSTQIASAGDFHRSTTYAART